ncbi:hypothetical protein AB0H76_15230 [Nocardia sp. NPDC050712]|uniref:hypothetical protein n=1 Tax=Nocardia sp. NPDC050712 TaxID=3155518 RepID=UPI0033D6D301
MNYIFIDQATQERYPFTSLPWTPSVGDQVQMTEEVAIETVTEIIWRPWKDEVIFNLGKVPGEPFQRTGRRGYVLPS